MEICTSIPIKEAIQKLECIAREYGLAVIEGTENGNDYPDAADNLRFIGELIFDMKCTIEDKKRQKQSNYRHDDNEETRNNNEQIRKA